MNGSLDNISGPAAHASTVGNSPATDDPFYYITNAGLDEVEMWVRFADRLIVRGMDSSNDDSEVSLSGAQALLDNSRRILLRLIDEDIHRHRESKLDTPGLSAEPIAPTPSDAAEFAANTLFDLGQQIRAIADLVDAVSDARVNSTLSTCINTMLPAMYKQIDAAVNRLDQPILGGFFESYCRSQQPAEEGEAIDAGRSA